MPDPVDSTSSTSTGGHGVPRRAGSRLMVLMFTDIEGSVNLKGSIGTEAYADALARHDAAFRSLIDRSPGAEILSDTGDGFFAAFASASDAVRAALRFQRAVSLEAAPLKVRCGLHAGDVTEMGSDAEGQRPKVVGLAADLAARLTHLGAGGQILLTRFPFNEARQHVRAHPGPTDSAAQALPEIRWVAHGEYVFKGSDEPVEVFEVGAAGFAPLAPPKDGEDARRALRPGDELTLGWRPAGGLEMHARPHWIIRDKLGEGGFGEVWLAEHDKTRTRRVFKFCFDSQRLRALKREVVLFRLLKDALGDRRDIARVTDYQFDTAPYFIEYEYVAGGALPEWSAARGGIDKVPLFERVRLVARIAEALAAAHSVGVLHKDIKPSNVLIGGQPDHASAGYESIYPILTDFGIGILTDRTQLSRRDITEFGFTQSAVTENESSRTGTRIYAPPESLLHRPHTVQGDVYALGVMLYQMVVGDLQRPLAEGWERQVDDELLRTDIAACVEGDPEHRLGSASELARRLHTLEERRTQLRAAAESARALAQRRQLVRVLVSVCAIAVVLVGALVYVLRQRNVAQAEAEKAEAIQRFVSAILSGTDANQAKRKDVTVAEVLDAAVPKLESTFRQQPEIEAPLRLSIGNSYLGLGLFDKSEPQFVRAIELYEASGRQSVDLAKAVNSLGAVYQNLGSYPKAEEAWLKALSLRRKLLGADHAEVGDTLWNLAILGYFTGDRARAEDYLRQSLAVREKALGAESAPVAQSLQLLSMLAMDRGDFSEAERLAQRSLTIREKTLGPDHVGVGETLTTVAQIHLRSRDFARAEQAFVRALSIFEAALPADHPHIAMTLTDLSGCRKELGKFNEALLMARRALELTTAKFGPDHPTTLRAVGAMAMAYEGSGNLAEAETYGRRAVETLSRTLGADHSESLTAKINLAHTLLFQDRPDEADVLLREALEVGRARNDALVTCTAEGLLVEVEVRRRNFEKAEAMAKDYRARMERLESPILRDSMVRNAEQVFTDLYDLWGKPELAAKHRPLARLGSERTSPPRQPASSANPSTGPAR